MLEEVASRLERVHGISLADQARESIRAAILDGSLPPSERLTIEQLAAELGVSRTPVREALKALEGDGLVRLLPHRGAVVEPFAREEIYHRYSIRAMLEGYAAELACQSDALGIAAELGANCEQLATLAARTGPQDVNQTKQLAELNRRFHAIIHEGSGSPTLLRLLGTLRNPASFTLAYWREPALREASLASHLEIAGAFRRDQPELARRLTEQHLLSARNRLMGKGPDSPDPRALARDAPQ